MTAFQNHIIQKQNIEVTLSSGKNANALQDKIKNIYYEKIIPQLDNLFSGFIKDDIVIRLDKLDIDLGHISENDLEKQLTEKIVASIRQQLESSLKFDVKDSRNVQLISGGQSVINAFLYFLSQGHFPWWCGINNLSILESTIIKQYKTDKDLPSKILQLITADAYVAARLNFQFSTSFRTFIIEKIFASQSITQRTFLRELLLRQDKFTATKNDVQHIDKKEIAENNFDDTTVNTQLKKDIEESNQIKEERKSDEHDQSSSQSSTIKQGQQDNNGLTQFNDKQTTSESSTIKPLSEENSEPANEISAKQNLKKQDDINTDKAVSAEDEKEMQQSGNPSSKENIDSQPDVLATNNKMINEADILINQKQLQEETLRSDKTKQRKIKNEFEKETIYLDLAGLVIIHPFIVEFFAALELTKNNRFINEASLHKAVHLLGYIATGDTEIEEQLLILPKLLCGMELTEPIEKEIIISDKEKHEVTELLSTVITYWNAIKNTSPDGLRGSFLLRSGKLSPREGGWQLDVEQKTWDILLGKLPWGISIIKLPWMPEILFVNWQ